MAYTIDEPKLGMLPLASIDSGITPPNQLTAIPTPPNVLGMIVRGKDPTYGEGEFILLKGVASTAVGTVVVYDPTTYITTRVAVTANQARPIAVSMAANTSASTFSWYQIAGTAVASKSVGSKLLPSVAIGILSVGKIANTSSGKEVLGAVSGAATVASATTTAAVLINRPHLQGRVS